MSVAHGTSEGSTPTIPGYEMQRLLGVGGMGKVYVARQETLKRLVCVKVLSIPEGEDPHLCRARFNREAELLASVSHPHIVSIFDFGTTADHGPAISRDRVHRRRRPAPVDDHRKADVRR